MNAPRLLLVGNPAVFHVGAHFNYAASALGLSAEIFNSETAFAGFPPLTKINWWLRGHRPARLTDFGQRVLGACREHGPTWLLATGIAPLSRHALAEIGKLGVKRLNYLTDDPWNPAHRAPWFMEALPEYDRVFSTRRANLTDLKRHGCRVDYLPFACAPEIHFAESPTAEEAERLSCDVLFAGGADTDRMPWITALIDGGFKLALYGGYWDRNPAARPFARGHADLPTLRKATAAAKVTLCLVRRANRDGHAMRSFEVPAMGGCMLTEDTEEHREIFGTEGAATIYFCDTAEMISKTRWLLDHETERRRLASAASELVRRGGHSYQDRLATMLNLADRGAVQGTTRN